MCPTVIFFWFSAHCSMISIQATINKEEKFVNDLEYFDIVYLFYRKLKTENIVIK